MRVTEIRKAIQHRLTSLNINKHNNIYRLVHAEGDDMPGCIIDVYNNVMVIQFHSIGMWRLRSQFTKILAKLMPEIDVIYDKSENTIPGSFKQEFNVKNEYLLKKVDDNQIVATENGNQFIINWRQVKKQVFLLTKEKIENYHI